MNSCLPGWLTAAAFSRRALLASTLMLLTFPAAAADSGSGMIVGRVSNAATGAFLEAATVSVEGAALQTASARGGEFSLNVPAGRHTLVVGFTGLDTARESVEVA